MKKGFIFVFLSTHIAFVFLQIHQYSQVIDILYQKQKYEKNRTKLLQKKQHLTHQVYALHNKAAIKKFAQNELLMVPIDTHQIKKLDNTHVAHQTV